MRNIRKVAWGPNPLTVEEVLGQTDSSWFSKVAGAQGPRPEQLMPQERGGWGLGLSSLPRKIRKDT